MSERIKQYQTMHGIQIDIPPEQPEDPIKEDAKENKQEDIKENTVVQNNNEQ